MSLLILLLFLGAQGDTLASKIMWKAYNRPVFDDMHAVVTMTLEDSKGNRRIRKMESWSKTKQKTHETKMFLKFLEPLDIKGTAFLIYEHKDKEDDMWFYLPALRKIKRLAASGKSRAFMGSDFSNYDIGGGEYEDWNYRLFGEVKIGEDSCWIIEALPKSKDVEKKTGYSKAIKWISKKSFVVLKSDYYDRSGSLFKRTTVDSVIHLKGVFFEKTMTAKNLDSGHKTIMEFQDLKVNQGLPDNLFTLRSLRE